VVRALLREPDTMTTTGTTTGARSLGTLVLLAATGAAQFTDVTASAGLDGAWLFSPKDSQTKSFMSAGVAVGDYDGDGWDDVAAALGSGRPIALYRNEGDGTFTDRAEAAGVDVMLPHGGLAWADVDNDGDLDLYLTPIDNQVDVAVVTPDGPKTITYPVRITSGTLPAVGEYRNYLFENQGDGTFTDATTEAKLHESGRWGAAFGDLDRDGWLDLVTVTWAGDDTHVYANAGDGTFRDVTSLEMKAGSGFGFSPRIADYDLDGDEDVLVAGDFVTSHVWRNDGGFTFTDVTAGVGVGTDENGMGSTLGDHDNDGDLDWFVTSIYLEKGEQPNPSTGTTGNRLYRNEGDGTFTDATDESGVRDGSWGWGASFLDHDNDADLDLVHTNGWNYFDYPVDAMRLFVNDGTGVFTDEAAALGIADVGQGRGLATFDHDRDGDLDVLVNNLGEGLVLYRNDVDNGHRWVEVRLLDTQGNTQGLGCRVTAILGGVPMQVRVVETGANFLSHNPASAWFGFGPVGGGPVRIVVDWPDGQKTQQLVDLDQRVVITR